MAVAACLLPTGAKSAPPKASTKAAAASPKAKKAPAKSYASVASSAPAPVPAPAPAPVPASQVRSAAVTTWHRSLVAGARANDRDGWLCLLAAR